MTIEGQPSYGWQLELDKIRAEGRPLIDEADYLIGHAKTLLDPETRNSDEYHALMDTILSIEDEMSVEFKINPLIGLNRDINRLAVHLDIIERRYGANPQEVMERKKSLLDNAYETILGAQDRVLGLYPQYNVPFRVPLRQSE